MHRIALIIALLASAGCASGPPGATRGPGGPSGPPPGLFVSPFGELFFSEPGQPWPVAAWFAGADTDADGRLTHSEFTADGLRHFQALDLRRDDRLTPDEIATYEQGLAAARGRMPGLNAPGMRPPGGPPPGFGGGVALAEPQQGPPGGGMPGGGMPGGGRGPPSGSTPRMRAPTGPMAYGPIAAAGFFNYPQPVKAADLDMNQTVTAQEWAQATDRWFVVLDTDEDGVLTLATLPRTPLQQLVER